MWNSITVATWPELKSASNMAHSPSILCPGALRADMSVIPWRLSVPMAPGCMIQPLPCLSLSAPSARFTRGLYLSPLGITWLKKRVRTWKGVPVIDAIPPPCPYSHGVGGIPFHPFFSGLPDMRWPHQTRHLRGRWYSITQRLLSKSVHKLIKPGLAGFDSFCR